MEQSDMLGWLEAIRSEVREALMADNYSVRQAALIMAIDLIDGAEARLED